MTDDFVLNTLINSLRQEKEDQKERVSRIDSIEKAIAKLQLPDKGVESMQLNRETKNYPAENFSIGEPVQPANTNYFYT